MVHGYHVIMGMYGFRLPNDPRGSWSEFVGAWELLRFGYSTRAADRTAKLSADESRSLADTRRNLKYPPVRLTGLQALSVGKGFASFCQTAHLGIWACSILPEHVHLVISRHRFAVERISALLKGAATKQLRSDGLDPMAEQASSRGPWARRQWSVFLDSEEAVTSAIRYVEQNPVKEGKPLQHWSFVTPFSGLELGGVVTYG